MSLGYFLPLNQSSRALWAEIFQTLKTPPDGCSTVLLPAIQLRRPAKLTTYIVLLTLRNLHINISYASQLSNLILICILHRHTIFLTMTDILAASNIQKKNPFHFDSLIVKIKTIVFLDSERYLNY